MVLFLDKLPPYALAAVALLGAFSRFTHGQYTPVWYAFQEYHKPDDGSVGAKFVPIIDTLVGLSLILGRQRLKFSAACISLVSFTIGLAMQVQSGKKFAGDVALVILGVAAVIVSRR